MTVPESESQEPSPVEPGVSTRRGFLAGAAGLTGVALAVGAWKPVLAMDSPLAAVGTAAVSNTRVGRIVLTLGKATAGNLFLADGGNAVGEVVNEKVGPDLFSRKHLAGVKYEDITISVGTGMSKGFYDWVGSGLTGRQVMESGSIAGATVNQKVFTQTDFRNAIISEIGFPALDAGSKDSAKMTIKFAPESTRTTFAAGGTVGQAPLVQEKWLASNFKLTINGLDTSFVSKIDSFNVKFNISGPNTDIEGGGRSITSIDIPNMKITVAQAHAQDFAKWHQDFVIDGNNSAENEKIGSLSYLSTNLKTELFRLDFSGLGIFALDPDPLTSGQEGVRHVTAQLYCEKMIFSSKI